MRFKQAIYESTQAPLARPLFPYAANAPKAAFKSPTTSH